jgi:hypothetical protein
MSNKPELPPRLKHLQRPVKHADKVEKIVGMVALGLGPAFMGLEPLTAAAASTTHGLLKIYQEGKKAKLQEILCEELRKGNVHLSDERLQSLVPMCYRIAESAKQGECEEILRILATFLRGEFEQEHPDPSNFARMARRVEGLSPTDLKVMSLIEAFIRDVKARNEPKPVGQPFVSATALGGSAHNGHQLSTGQIQEALVDLASRGFLLADGATRSAKSEEYYFPTSSFNALIARARQSKSGTDV